MRLSTSVVLSASLCLSACGGGGAGIQVGAESVSVQTDQMLATYTRKDSIDDVYMIFGGMSEARSDMTSKATIVGLSMADAQPIYAEHPDFHRCSSPGAAQAKSLIKQMDLVPADAQVLAVLQDALVRHKQSLQAGGDRVCVKLSGCRLQMSSAKVKDQEVLEQLPGPVRKDHYLVESAEVVSAESALQGG